MQRSLFTSCCLIVGLAFAGWEFALAQTPSATKTTPPASQPAAIETKVVNSSKEQGIVGLAAGKRSGVAVGDDFWLLTDAGVAGWGEVFVVTADKSAGRLQPPRAGTSMPNIATEQSAVILRRDALPVLRDRLPPGATVRGKIARVAPGRLTAWIDVNADAGLRSGDQLLVTRKGLPLSRGRIALLDRNAALTTLEPLVGNALAEPGDALELWPAPSDAHWGRLTTTVLQVVEIADGVGKGARISIAGSTADRIALDRLVDVYRGRKYIGVARIVEVSSPNSKADMVVSASRMREDPQHKQPDYWPAEGDQAIVRSAPDAPPGPMLVAVFQITEDYCLLATGEADGIKRGETFLVRRQDPSDATFWHDVAQLTIKKVELDYSGAQVKPLTSQVAGLTVWDMAERQVSGIEQWRTVGIVESTDAASRTAMTAVNTGSAVAVGDVVSWMPDGDGAIGGAVVIRREPDRLVLYVPPGWGDMAALPRARVDARQTAR